MCATRVVTVREPFDVYIGRGLKGTESGYFGNPFPMAGESQRDEVIKKFRAYFLNRIQTDPTFKRRVETLRGKRLGCFCAPRACHGDVYAEYLDHGIIQE